MIQFIQRDCASMQDYYSLSELSMISFANLILIEQVMKQLHMKVTLAF